MPFPPPPPPPPPFPNEALVPILKMRLHYSLLPLCLILQATGSRLGTIVEIFSGLVLVLVIGFVYSWLLTLVVLGILPLVIFAALLQVQALAGYASNSKKSLEDAGKVAVDSIENIRTVATLGIEETFFNKYRGLIRKPHR